MKIHLGEQVNSGVKVTPQTAQDRTESSGMLAAMALSSLLHEVHDSDLQRRVFRFLALYILIFLSMLGFLICHAALLTFHELLLTSTAHVDLMIKKEGEELEPCQTNSFTVSISWPSYLVLSCTESS
ncbi:hypothetical protein RRG08_024848 [Elysia crispata]|uniref:Uncharacterized protein n=1 Tax=Elysia crispata TaxID=231223 RepID=A0AAE0YK01_9GAST|nr:hypothetical protein RRG08_024848 [Elysia crispata]